MNSITTQLARFGAELPTKSWSGDLPPGIWGSPSERKLVVEEVSRHLFAGGTAFNVDNYTEVSPGTGLALIALGLRPPFLSVLGVIGRQGQFVPAEAAPAPEVISELKAVLPGIGPGTKFLTNVNETGAFYQVDPRDGDLEELLVVAYSPDGILALYWGRPID